MVSSASRTDLTRFHRALHLALELVLDPVLVVLDQFRRVRDGVLRSGTACFATLGPAVSTSRDSGPDRGGDRGDHSRRSRPGPADDKSRAPPITPTPSNKNGQTNTSGRRNLGSLRASRAISSSSMRVVRVWRFTSGSAVDASSTASQLDDRLRSGGRSRRSSGIVVGGRPSVRRWSRPFRAGHPPTCRNV